MDLRRFIRILATRWWLIALVAVVGGAAAVGVARARNASIETEFQATAPVVILRTFNESDDAYADRLILVEANAEVAMTADLTADPEREIVSDVDKGRLEFIAFAPEESIAIAEAAALKDAYLLAEPTGNKAAQMKQNLDDLAIKINTLRAELAAVTAIPTLDPSVAALISLYETELANLHQRWAALTFAIAFPTFDPLADEAGSEAEAGADDAETDPDEAPAQAESIEQELARTERFIRSISAELAAVRAANDAVIVTEGPTSLDVMVKSQQLQDLESEYISTDLALQELISEGSEVVESSRIETVNVTPAPLSTTQAGLFGFAVGALLATAALVISDRLQRPVLGIEDDLPLPTLARVDRARSGGN